MLPNVTSFSPEYRFWCWLLASCSFLLCIVNYHQMLLYHNFSVMESCLHFSTNCCQIPCGIWESKTVFYKLLHVWIYIFLYFLLFFPPFTGIYHFVHHSLFCFFLHLHFVSKDAYSCWAVLLPLPLLLLGFVLHCPNPPAVVELPCNLAQDSLGVPVDLSAGLGEVLLLY